MRIHHATAAKAKKFQITLTISEQTGGVVATKGAVTLATGADAKEVLEDAITKATGHVAKSKGAKAPKTAVLPSTGKEVSIEERTARGEGWTKKRGGGFRHVETDEESDAANWVDLCEEQGLIEPEADEDDEDSDADQSKSIVKAKYRAKYKPTKDKCGDPLSFRLSDHVSREDDAGDMKVDLDALRTFAKANECWVPLYASLKSRTGDWNGGLARMNVANRLRARLRRIAKEQERPFNIDKDVVWA